MIGPTGAALNTHKASPHVTQQPTAPRADHPRFPSLRRKFNAAPRCVGARPDTRLDVGACPAPDPAKGSNRRGRATSSAQLGIIGLARDGLCPLYKTRWSLPANAVRAATSPTTPAASKSSTAGEESGFHQFRMSLTTSPAKRPCGGPPDRRVRPAPKAGVRLPNTLCRAAGHSRARRRARPSGPTKSPTINDEEGPRCPTANLTAPPATASLTSRS